MPPLEQVTFRFEAGGWTSSILSSFFLPPYCGSPGTTKEGRSVLYTNLSMHRGIFSLKPLIQNCNVLCSFLLFEVLLQNLLKIMDSSWTQYVLG